MTYFEKKAREIVEELVKKRDWSTEEWQDAEKYITKTLQHEHNHLLAIVRVADEMRPYMNQFKGAAVDELKSRYDRLREREGDER